MKFLLFLVVVLIGLWFWKQRQKKPAKPKAPPPSDPQVIMLQCAVCGVHVPDTDATAGQRGAYCSAEHRRQAEGI
jgi:uncharacterized protein